MGFEAVQQTQERLVLELNSNLVTLVQYPFNFCFRIAYKLRENTVDITYEVHNRGNVKMPFGIGAHPGFNVPPLGTEQFDDYELKFSCPCQPDRVGFTSAVYLSGADEQYPLREDQFIDLRHELFDEDAVFLKNMAR